MKKSYSNLEIISDAEFAVIVADDCRGHGDPEVIDGLRDPAVLARWRAALVVLKLDIQRQLTSKRASLEADRLRCLQKPDGRDQYRQARDGFLSWRSRTMNVLMRAEKRLIEVRGLLREENTYRHGQVQSRETLLAWAATLIPTTSKGAAWHAALEARGGAEAEPSEEAV